ncbi:hypothetical protein HHK36_016959 [Tetracentron sinense]|uniref:Uncharacterized protein n=1 Tax=Tetracentron sinense TaxID=13715 RepID=A0A834Z4C8_TETSI|nr:hypothetical protein HHK36_016959 [Tetracentron sinense]
MLTDQWFKFDDERFTKEDTKRALEEQYGGEEELPQTNLGLNKTPFTFTKYSNAYMLVYIRKSDKEKIIYNLDDKDIAEHLRKGQEEKEHEEKEKSEAHLYTIIKVARNEDIFEQIGKDIYFDIVDHDKVRSFHIQKQMPFNIFKVLFSVHFASDFREFESGGNGLYTLVEICWGGKLMEIDETKWSSTVEPSKIWPSMVGKVDSKGVGCVGHVGAISLLLGISKMVQFAGLAFLSGGPNVDDDPIHLSSVWNAEKSGDHIYEEVAKEFGIPVQFQRF